MSQTIDAIRPLLEARSKILALNPHDEQHDRERVQLEREIAYLVPTLVEELQAAERQIKRFNQGDALVTEIEYWRALALGHQHDTDEFACPLATERGLEVDRLKALIVRAHELLLGDLNTEGDAGALSQLVQDARKIMEEAS